MLLVLIRDTCSPVGAHSFKFTHLRPHFNPHPLPLGRTEGSRGIFRVGSREGGSGGSQNFKKRKKRRACVCANVAHFST